LLVYGLQQLSGRFGAGDNSAQAPTPAVRFSDLIECWVTTVSSIFLPRCSYSPFLCAGRSTEGHRVKSMAGCGSARPEAGCYRKRPCNSRSRRHCRRPDPDVYLGL